jgi:hypothetical protein
MPMLILIHILCVYVLNVDVLLFSTGSQDVTTKMITNIQGDSGGTAILWEMIVCVILSKKVHINICPIFEG